MSRFGTATIFLLLVLSFQNCSNAHFVQSMTGISGKGLGPAAIIGLTNQVAPNPEMVVPATPGGVADHTIDSAIAECDAMSSISGSLPLIPAGASVFGQRGRLDLKASNIDFFEGNAGNFRILGLNGTAVINSVVANTGNLVLCGVDVARVGSSSGNLLIVGGDVGDITGFSGNIKIIGGRVVGVQSGVSGTVIEVPVP